MENKKWILLCILGGVLMLIGSIVGNVTFFALIFSVAEEQLGAESAAAFSLILTIFSYIAMGGGISVIIGSLIVMMNKYGIGKFIIGLGAGMGLIGLIIFLITSIIGGSLIGDVMSIINGVINGSYGFAGVLLTIFSRRKLKKQA